MILSHVLSMAQGFFEAPRLWDFKSCRHLVFHSKSFLPRLLQRSSKNFWPKELPWGPLKSGFLPFGTAQALEKASILRTASSLEALSSASEQSTAIS